MEIPTSRRLKWWQTRNAIFSRAHLDIMVDQAKATTAAAQRGSILEGVQHSSSKPLET